MTWASSYVGKPFATGGRGPSAFDCWGLVRSVYADQLNIDLPHHCEIATCDYRRVAQQMERAYRAAPWEIVDRPRAFDVMVARRDMHSRYAGHVGVMIDASRVLHVWEGRNVHISRVRDAGVAGLILAYSRHEGAP